VADPHATSSARILALDALRGVAVFLMIEQHLGVWLWRGPARGRTVFDYPHLVVFNALGGLAAPLFVTLAGIGAALFAARRGPGAGPVIVRRGLALMALGYALNLLTPSWFRWGSWFVLHMMGFAMVLSPVFLARRDRTIVAAAALVLVGTAALQGALDTPPVLTNARMANLHMPGGPLRLALAEGQFPIFPWLAFFLLGIVAGRAVAGHQPRRIAHLFAGCAAAGLALAAAHAAGLLPHDHPLLGRLGRIRLGFYPASPATALLLCAAALGLVTLALTHPSRLWARPTAPLVTLGRGSLTLLFAHVVLFREWTRPLGLWHANDAPRALAILAGFLVACVLLTRAWQRVGYRYGAEWLLRRAGG